MATNALELGVDIGQMGAAVVAGYPGTIASLWQQAGRAGRRSDTSAAVLVASAAPLDQFIAGHPTYLFEQSPEMGLIHPDNLAILVRHLRCAAFELPFAAGETFGAYGDVSELLAWLAEEGELHASQGTYHWVAAEYPAQSVSLRASSEDTVVIQDVSSGRPEVIGSIERAGAPQLLHEGAVYIHEGRTFLVRRLDWENAVAEVEPAELDYYTDAAQSTDLEVLEVYDAEEFHPARRAHGRVRVTTQSTSYRKVKRYTHETLRLRPNRVAATRVRDLRQLVVDLAGAGGEVGGGGRPAAAERLRVGLVAGARRGEGAGWLPLPAVRCPGTFRQGARRAPPAAVPGVRLCAR